MAPSWSLYPLVILATAAACIASQAVISGAFSLTRQAVQLGYCPRMEIRHTSSHEIGQIYIPLINWMLLLGVVLLVWGFGTSTNLAAAYGIAVTSTMVITTVLAYFVAIERWKWPRLPATALVVLLLAMDSAFFGANMVKVAQGGWFPLTVALGIFTLLTTWKKGRTILASRLRETSLPLDQFLGSLRTSAPTRVRGTAVFMTGNMEGTPTALLHNLKHNKVIHDQVILLTVSTLEIPHVREEERMEFTMLESGFWRVILRYGFMEDPDVPAALQKGRGKGLTTKPMDTTYFLGRETLIPTKRPGMALWREALFSWMSRNARTATAFFHIPPGRVVELGAQIEL
jgi:KUP system potassium uptake protein